MKPKISPFLWFAHEAEQAVRFYTGIFPDSKIGEITRYTEVGREQHGQEPGTVMVVSFELCGQPFSALNGGPIFKFSEAVSFVIDCGTQEEVDHYWSRLSEGGDPECQQCGWLKDKFGLSWQIVPTILPKLLSDPDRKRADRAMAAMMGMKKLDIAALQKAADGAG